MNAPIPNLSRLQREILQKAGDTWSRKPFGYSATVKRLEDLGLLSTKRERANRVSRVMATFIRRTDRGREALGLPATKPKKES